MKKLFVLALLAAMLSGCNSGYHQKGSLFRSDGHSENKLGENVFQIAFEGNKEADSEQVSDLNLLRSAEVALKHGFNYFVILQTTGSDTNPIFEEVPTLSSATTDQNKTHSAFSTILCSINKPDISHGQVYDAAAIAKSIRIKYGL